MDPGLLVLGLADTWRLAASSKRPPTQGMDQASTAKLRAKVSLT